MDPRLGRPSLSAPVPDPQILDTDYSDAELDNAVKDIICPEDSYTSDGTYWADLPFGQRLKWVNQQDKQEASSELRAIWTSFKEDPLEPLKAYSRRYVVNGMGLFVEGFTLFASGNLKSLFEQVWPLCWDSATVCDKTWLAAVSYLEIVGIIVGQILVGFEADSVGRRFGAIQDATLLTLGTVMLCAAWGVNLNGWVICYAWSLFVYGVGVGGEYPITGTRTIELVGGGKEVQKADKLHRGRTLILSFLMQGWGQLFNQVVLIVLLLIFHGSGNPPYTAVSTQWTYRVSFAVILPFTLFMLYLRVFKIKDYNRKLNANKAKAAVTGYDTSSLKLAVGHYGGRLLATAGTWFCNDFFFYGNKLFQSAFIKVIVGPEASVMTSWLYNLINIGVSLCGYYLAAFLVDNKVYGRKHLQGVGFFFVFICFVIPAFDFGPIQTAGGIHAFQFLYYMSSFFNQFGPNTVTFLVAAEVFPTTIRGSAHGFSAACGKLGALAPAIIYNYVDAQTRFYIVPWFGIAGFILTYVFLPDTTGLDLKEQERYFSYVKAGRESEYHGIAVHPRHLSLWEHLVLKRSQYYNPELDKKAKVEELKALYHKLHNAEWSEKTLAEDIYDADDASIISAEVKAYFERRTPRSTPRDTPQGTPKTGHTPPSSVSGRIQEKNEEK